MFGRKKRSEPTATVARTVPQTKCAELPCFFNTGYQTRAERELYYSLRNSVPVIDAALDKIIRLIGGFKIVAADSKAQREADEFLRNVRVNGTAGFYQFIQSYLESLLTYGEAVGELIPDRRRTGIAALYNASLNDAEIRAGSSPLEHVVYVNGPSGFVRAPRQQLIVTSLINPVPGTVRGKSLLSGLPFVSEILLRILESVKNNWERVGDVRFSVSYKPEPGEAFSEENAALIAGEWKKAMRSDSVCDFVSLGNVSIRAIGSEIDMPDCETPLRALLEQIMAKLGIPPFLLGISWSSTERMSEQQADILTSELDYYRSSLDPVIRRILKTHLELRGFNGEVRIAWDDINLQDTVELSQARLNNAKAMQIEKEIGWEESDD